MGKKKTKNRRRKVGLRALAAQSRIWAEGPTTRPDNLLLLDQRPI